MLNKQDLDRAGDSTRDFAEGLRDFFHSNSVFFGKTMKWSIIVALAVAIIGLLVFIGWFAFFLGIFNLIKDGLIFNSHFTDEVASAIAASIMAIAFVAPLLIINSLSSKDRDNNNVKKYRGLATVYLVAFSFAVSLIMGSFWLMAPVISLVFVGKKGRLYFWLISFLFIALFSGGVALSTKDFMFDRYGRPLYSCCERPDGTLQRYPKSVKFDELFGIPTKPLTRKILISDYYRLQSEKTVGEVLWRNGKLVKWYSIYPNGEWKTFDSPGINSELGTKVIPFTPESALKYWEWKESKKGRGNEPSSSVKKEETVLKDTLVIPPPIAGTRKIVEFFKGRITNKSRNTILVAFDSSLCPPHEILLNEVASLDMSQIKPSLPLWLKINPDKQKNVTMMEGKHYFAFFDVNGNNIYPNIYLIGEQKYIAYSLVANNYIFRDTILIESPEAQRLQKYNEVRYKNLYYRDVEYSIITKRVLTGFKERQFKFDNESACHKIFWYHLNYDHTSYDSSSRKIVSSLGGNRGGISDLENVSYDDYCNFLLRRKVEQAPPFQLMGENYRVNIAYVFMVPPRNGWNIEILDDGIYFNF